MLGRITSAIRPRPVVPSQSHATKAWSTGAVGEERISERLDAVPGIIALHDRRMPGSKASIDHIVASANGVHVIDAKRYRGRVGSRDVRSLFRPDVRLIVGGCDRTKLVASVLDQAGRVAAVVRDTGVPVYAGLCLVDAEWALFARPFFLGGAWIGSPEALAKRVSAMGSLDRSAVEATARRIAAVFEPA